MTFTQTFNSIDELKNRVEYIKTIYPESHGYKLRFTLEIIKDYNKPGNR